MYFYCLDYMYTNILQLAPDLPNKLLINKPLSESPLGNYKLTSCMSASDQVPESGDTFHSLLSIYILWPSYHCDTTCAVQVVLISILI